jgi:choline dehydrogenase
VDFDYIVVGAGTAGCVLAARLTQDATVRVLLLEAGIAERTHGMTIPNAWPENLGTAAEWGDFTTSQAIYPRGRALGGSSAINAMAHLRGHRSIYDGWAAGGATGWAFDDLLPYFKRSERAEGHDPAVRGTEGPIRVAQAATGRHRVAEAFASALAADGYPVSDDLSASKQEGVAWIDLAIADGERVSSADGYLRPVLHRENLVVEADCRVTGLDVHDGTCTGLRYLRAGKPVRAHTSGEVILCAGAIGSPALLMASGIGPAHELAALGVEPVADLGSVGANLADHPIIMVSYSSPSQLPVSNYNNGETCAALRSKLATDHPDLHLFTILLPLAPAGLQPPATGYTLVAAVVAPDSSGSVRLASADPLAAPLIDPGFLADERDLDRLEEGAEIIRRIGADSAFAEVREAEIWPGPDTRTSGGLRDYIRRGVGSYYHPVGTCRMGSDNAAVVDTDLRVRGIAGLRVADASVMPTITNAHPNATVLAIAERAADLIRGQHAKI